jgi:hypothetical protein
MLLHRANKIVVTLTFVALIVLSIGYYTFHFHFQFQVESASLHQVWYNIDPDHCVPTTLPITDTRVSSQDIIPNIVHYVWLLNGHDNFSVDFKTFISIYSASFYFQPDKIYIHTDASQEQWEQAKNNGNDATRWTLKIPKITYHWVPLPQYTVSCVKIEGIEHKSDFVRTQQLHYYGGIYMDTDVVPLRDVRALRETGFSNIFGLTIPGRVNNGFMMGKARNALLSVYMAEQHRVFNNGWITHSVELLTTLSHRLHAVPKEVMILEMAAFSPSSWSGDAIKALFMPHEDTTPSLYSIENVRTGELLRVPTGFQDTVDYWNSREWVGKLEWEIDYSSSYVIHAFDQSDRSAEDYWPNQVNLDYIMARKSNYARATYPAIKHGVDVGLIDRSP